MKLEELERVARMELQREADLPQFVKPWLLFVLSLPFPYVLATAVLFVPLLGLILTAINVLLWLKSAFSLPPSRFLLPSLLGMLCAVLLLPFSRWGMMLLATESKGGIVPPSSPMPVVGYALLASSVALSFAYLFGLSAILWCRLNWRSSSCSNGL